MLDAETLIKKHRRKGVFIDTNLFVLWLVGLVNPKRSLVEWFGAPLVTTPHVLSQVSDLTDLSGRERTVIRELLKSTIDIVEETYDTARHLVQHPLFERFGLGDASVAAVCERNVVVLTADVQLQLALGLSGLDAINFNHVRPLGWDRR
jgi:hypothetical protein